MIYKIFFNHSAETQRFWFRGRVLSQRQLFPRSLSADIPAARDCPSEVRKNVDSINAKDIFCMLSAWQTLIVSCKLKRANEGVQ